MASGSQFSDVPAGFSVVQSPAQPPKPVPQFADVPAGFSVVQQPPAPAPVAYSDVPAGYTTLRGAPVPPPTDPTAEANLWNSIGRGSANVRFGVDALWYAFGRSNPDEFAKNLVANEMEIARLPKTEAELRAEEGGISIPKLFANPTAIAGLLGESAAGLGATVAGAIGGGLVAGPVGAIGGLAGGGAFSAFGGAFKDYLRQQGVNTGNEANIRAALEDQNLVNEAYWYAAKQSGVSGLFNAVGGAVGGKIATRFFVPGSGVRGVATGVGGEVGLGAGLGAGANVASSVVGGHPVDPSAAAVDAFLGGLLSGPFVIPGMFETARANRYNTKPGEADLTATVESAAVRPEDTSIRVEEGPSVPPLRPEDDPNSPDYIPPVDGLGNATEASRVRPGSERVNMPAVKVRDELFTHGLTHLDALEEAAKRFGTTVDDLVQDPVDEGYVTSSGRFVGRIEAAEIARAADQIDETTVLGPELIRGEEGSLGSENLRPDTDLDVTARPTVQRAVQEHNNRVRMAEVAAFPFGRPTVDRQQSRFTDWLFGRSKGEEQKAKVEPAAKFAQEWKERNFAKEYPQRVTGTVDEWVSRAETLRADFEKWPTFYRELEQLDTPTLLKVAQEFVAGPKPRSRAEALRKIGHVHVEAELNYRKGIATAGRTAASREPPLRQGEVRLDPKNVEAYFKAKEWKQLIPATTKALEVMQKIAAKMKIAGIKVIFGEETAPAAFGDIQQLAGGGYLMRLSLRLQSTAEEVYATVMHEFGHVVMFDKWATAPNDVKLAIEALFREEFANKIPGLTIKEAFYLREDPISLFHDRMKLNRPFADNRAMSIPDTAYWYGFNEWFAQKTAKWSQTSDKALNVVDKFFKALANRIRTIVNLFSQKTGINFRVEDAFTKWMDSYMDAVTPATAKEWIEFDRRTMEENQRALGRDVEATPRTAETNGGRNIGNLFDDPPEGFANGWAAADKMNWIYKWGLGLWQLAARNRHIRKLQMYNETVGEMFRERVQIVDRAETTRKAWRRLGVTQSHNLTLLIDDYMNQRYLTPAERARKVERKPSEAELRAMIDQYGISAQGLEVFRQIVKDFDMMLERYKEVLVKEANKIQDPIFQANRLVEIDKAIVNMRRKPYFPAMRFGKFTMTIRDDAGNVVHFEQFESKRQLAAAVRAAKGSDYPEGLGFKYFEGVMPEDVQPFVGMPPQLLDLVKEKLDLSPSQRRAFEELKFELAPAQSFKHRFQRKRLVSGYSHDFMRAYASYFFHGANHLTRAKYADQLREYVKGVRDEAKFMPDGKKRGEIGNYMANHLEKVILDPRADLVKLRGMIFHWALGFSPAAAAINLTQTVVGTLPYLGAKFGDFRAMQALLRAGAKGSTYYREATLKGVTDIELRALGRGIEDGIITEAMAPNIAGVAEGRNPGKRFGAAAEEMWEKGINASASMFQLTEQLNRRWAFRAAWKLAFDNVNHKHVLDVIRANELLYTKLRNEGWSHREAAAYAVAKDAVQSTQYVYSSWARPRFMRGKLGTIFVFKSFLQNTLFMLWNNPSVAARSLLVMGFLGGAMGIPGTEDLKDWLKVIAFRLFGEDFDLEKEARKFVMEVSDGTIPPDILLHGAARRGFGVPAVMDGMGMPFPQIDMSRAFGVGRISPIELSPLIGPAVDDSDEAIARSLQQGSGAAFGVFFNIYKAMTNSQLSPMDFKRWEPAVPRAIGGVSRAWRARSEGQERTATGATIAEFDPDDPEHNMEMLAMAMGFQSLRVTSQWDRIRAVAEVTAFWDLRRANLLQQMNWAVMAEDQEAIKSVGDAVAKFNRDLPSEAKGKRITRENIQSSVRAKAKNRALTGAGIPPQVSDRGLAVKVSELYPEAVVGVQKVK